MKEDKKTMILTTLVCLLPVIAGLILLPKLPQQIVTHWDASGVPNGWSSKFTGAVVFPGILLILNLIMPALMKVDPRYANMSRKTKVLGQWIIPFVSLFGSSTTLADGMGVPVNITVTAPLFVGFLFMIIGNYLPKMTQSYTMGIKLPWTLYSEDNWNKTHRIAGLVWMIGGFLIMCMAFFPWGSKVITVIFICMVGIPVGYSYLYFRRTSRERQDL